MPQANDWLFDKLWDLSDKAHESDLPAVAEKLEEAMDIYLVEIQDDVDDVGDVAVFQSQRYQDANRRIMEMARNRARTMKAFNALVAQARAHKGKRDIAAVVEMKPAVAPSPAVEQKTVAPPRQVVASGRQVGESFAWPF